MTVTALRDYIDPHYAMVPVLANAVIGRGAALGVSSGYARLLNAGDEFLGFAEEDFDATGESSGAYKVRAVVKGRVKLDVVGVNAATHINDTVYATGTTGNSFTLTSTSNTPIGKIVERISGTTCWVQFEALSQQSL